MRRQLAADSDEGERSDDDADRRRQNVLEFQDIGGGIYDDIIEDGGDVPVHEVSPHPLHDHREAIAFAFQQRALQEIESKKRKVYEIDQVLHSA